MQLHHICMDRYKTHLNSPTLQWSLCKLDKSQLHLSSSFSSVSNNNANNAKRQIKIIKDHQSIIPTRIFGAKWLAVRARPFILLRTCFPLLSGSRTQKIPPQIITVLKTSPLLLHFCKEKLDSSKKKHHIGNQISLQTLVVIGRLWRLFGRLAHASCCILWISAA